MQGLSGEGGGRDKKWKEHIKKHIQVLCIFLNRIYFAFPPGSQRQLHT